MGLISELTLGHHHVAGLSQMVFAQGLQWRGSMGYTILRHLTSPGAVNTREISSSLQKKWRAGNPSISIFYHIILSI